MDPQQVVETSLPPASPPAGESDPYQILPETPMGAAGLTAKHFQAIRLLVQGQSQAETARIVGVHQTLIGMWLKRADVQDELEKFREQIRQRVSRVVTSKLLALAPEAIEVSAHLMRKSKSDKVRLEAVRDVLDRAGFKPVDRHQVAHAFVLDAATAAVIQTVMKEIAHAPHGPDPVPDPAPV